MMKGGCFCGFIRYEAGGQRTGETNCHCSICRRASGAAFVTWFTVPFASFQIVSGQPTGFASSDHATRTFCPRCGTALTFRSSHLPDAIDVTTCSLDSPELVPPKDNTHTSARLPWVALENDIPAFPGARTEQA